MPADFDRTISLDSRGDASGIAYSAFIGPQGTGDGVIDTGNNAVANEWTFVAARYDALADNITVFVSTDFSAPFDPILTASSTDSMNANAA